MKKCTKCKVMKPHEEFYAHLGYTDGHKRQCKKCELSLRRHRYTQNKQRASEQAMNWRIRNYSKYRQYMNDWQKTRRIMDPLYKLHMNVSRRLRSRLSKGGSYCEQILGYTIAELKKHLEIQFQPGMTWDNYGYRGWHIDHIKPVSSFSASEIRECWSLSNLRPLWANENIKKGARV